MGNYNTQYQSYYNNLAKKQRGASNFAGEGNKQNWISNFYIKRLTKELVGVLVLFMVVLFFKIVVTPKTQYVYNYSKQVINKQYKYSTLMNEAKAFRLENIKVTTVNFMEKVKSTIFNEDGIVIDKNK